MAILGFVANLAFDIVKEAKLEELEDITKNLVLDDDLLYRIKHLFLHYNVDMIQSMDSFADLILANYKFNKVYYVLDAYNDPIKIIFNRLGRQRFFTI